MGDVYPDIRTDGGGTELSNTSFNLFLVGRNGWKTAERRVEYELFFTRRAVMPLGPIKSASRSEAEWR